MTDIPSLISRTRLELGDTRHPFDSVFQGDNLSSVITLTTKPVDQNSLTVLQVDDNTNLTLQLSLGVDYDVDEQNGTLTLVAPLSVGQSLLINGSAYRYFTDTDWTTFVTTAVTEHLHHRQEIRDISLLPVEEEYPVALLAVVQALYALATDAAFDIDISTPEGVAIPRRQRYEQLTSMLAARIDQYNKWAMAFNCGPFRVEMFDLRRVSRTTNRLVPIYTAQELWDTRPPTEQYPPIDPLGDKLTPVPTYQQTINLVGFSYQTFQSIIATNQDLTGYTVKASVRRYPNSVTPLAVIKVVVTDVVAGTVQLNLDANLMYVLGTSKFWDLQLIDSAGNVQTIIGGTFDAIRQGTYG